MFMATEAYVKAESNYKRDQLTRMWRPTRKQRSERRRRTAA